VPAIGLKFSHTENGSHSMLLARLKVNAGVQNVARFSKQEPRPFAIRKIPQLGRFLSELAFASRIRRRILSLFSDKTREGIGFIQRSQRSDSTGRRRTLDSCPIGPSRGVDRPFPFREPVSAAPAKAFEVHHVSATLWANQIDDRRNHARVRFARHRLDVPHCFPP